MHASIRVFVHKHSTPQQVQFATMAIPIYVEQAPKIFGCNFNSYNIHGHLHLIQDYKNFGPLDSISAFEFENYMTTLRRYCRKPTMYLQQIYNRRDEDLHKIPVYRSIRAPVEVSQRHGSGPLVNVELSNCVQYKKVQYHGQTFRLDNRDNTCITLQGSICIIRNILVVNGINYLAVQKFDIVESFYDVGLPSLEFGVYQCSNLRIDIEMILLTDVKMKCFRMPQWAHRNPSNDTSADSILPNCAIVATLLHEN